MSSAVADAGVLIPVQKAIASRLGQPHRSTVLRWILDGIRRKDGTVVKLRAWRFGSRWSTTTEAVDDFVSAVAEASDGTAELRPRTLTVRDRATRDAEAELKSMGM
jgi:hypothetical protein